MQRKLNALLPFLFDFTSDHYIVVDTINDAKRIALYASPC